MSAREDQFAALWERLGPTGFEWTREHVFAPPRRWRFDFAYLPAKVAVEIEGVTFFGGAKSRHQTANGLEADCEKYDMAVELGWRVLRYTQQDLDKRPVDVIEQVERVLMSGGDYASQDGRGG